MGKYILLLKANWFKLSILILLVVLTAVYSWSVIGNKTNKTTDSLNLDQQCYKDGMAWFNSYKKSSAPYGDITFFTDPEFNHNNAISRCLVRFTVTDNTSRIMHLLVDVYSNKELLDSVVTLEEDKPNRTQKRNYFSGMREDEFWEATNKLMVD